MRPFGKTDPILAGYFFCFTFLLELVVSFLLHLVILSLVVSIVASYLYGGLQAVPRPHATVPASSPGNFGCGCLGDYWGAVLDRPLLAYTER